MSSSEKLIVNRFFSAMQVGATAEAEMMSLFHDDAVYIEPFTGRMRTHSGKLAIRACMVEGWRNPLPEVRIEINALTVEGAEVIVQWTCHSPGLPGGTGKGENRFTLQGGLIIRLETRIHPVNL
ncbi:MAG: nuclear transport factor 2 family protein [Planctomycetaceae bacterium]